MAKLKIKRLPECAGRTLFIGDVHGCSEELKALIKAFSPGPQDRLVAVGDLINRGPDSPSVLAMVREYSIETILGNHEERLLAARLQKKKALLKQTDFPTFDQIPKRDWKWISGWPHILEIPSLNILVVHGGFLPGIPWSKQAPEVVTGIQVIDGRGQPAKRSDTPSGTPWADLWTGPEHVIYGHTPRPEPILQPLATGLDTGCVYGYSLTGISLPERMLYQVKAGRAYAND